jgi:hypothetical protein
MGRFNCIKYLYTEDNLHKLILYIHHAYFCNGHGPCNSKVQQHTRQLCNLIKYHFDCYSSSYNHCMAFNGNNLQHINFLFEK